MHVSDYDFVVQRFHDPTYNHVPFLIKVRNADAVSMDPARPNAGLELTDGYSTVNSMDKLFDLIKVSCGQGGQVTVEYDKELGYPVSVNISSPPTKGVHNVDRYLIENFRRF
jgi:hypothetical protein